MLFVILLPSRPQGRELQGSTHLCWWKRGVKGPKGPGSREGRRDGTEKDVAIRDKGGEAVNGLS